MSNDKKSAALESVLKMRRQREQRCRLELAMALKSYHALRTCERGLRECFDRWDRKAAALVEANRTAELGQYRGTVDRLRRELHTCRGALDEAGSLCDVRREALREAMARREAVEQSAKAARRSAAEQRDRCDRATQEQLHAAYVRAEKEHSDV